MKAFTFIVLFVIISGNIYSQNKELEQLEDSIEILFSRIILAKNDDEKKDYNRKIENLFEKSLNKKNSFEYPFNKLKYVSKLNSNDEVIRIINWNIPNNDGSYKYFGFIQHKKKNNDVSVFKLTDNSAEIIDPQIKKLNNNDWYGALYYKILTNTYKKKTYYTLLAWDGNDNFTNKKIIDILTIKGKNVYFGSPKIKMGNKTFHRIIFEYAKQAKMMLSYDEKVNMIVFDHLAPSLKKLKGQYMYYGPDLSQDGLEFIDGYWVLKENLDLRNEKEDTQKKPIKTSN